jgi:hypothetical protein
MQATEPDRELTHPANTFASEFTLLAGTVPFPAGVFARSCPVAPSYRLFTVRKALVRPVLLLLLDPTVVVPGVMN